MERIADKTIKRTAQKMNIEERKEMAKHWEFEGFHWVANYKNIALYEKEKNGIIYRRCYNYCEIGGIDGNKDR